jgi:hypothetical protein
MATPADNQKQIDSLEAQIQQIRNTKYRDDPFGAKNDPEILGLRSQQKTLQTQNSAVAPNNPATDAYEGIDRNSGQGTYVNSQTGERYTGPVKETPQTQVTTQANAENIAEATSKGPVGSVANTTVPGTGENNTLSQVNTATNPTAQPNTAVGQPQGTNAAVDPQEDPTLDPLTDDEIDQQRENQLITVDEDGNLTAENPYDIQGRDDAQLTDEQIDLARENQLIEQDEDGNLTAENPYDIQGRDDAQLTDEQIDLERENQLIVQDEDGNLTAENPYTAIGDRELSEEEQQEQDNPIDYSNEVEVDPYSDVEGDYGAREEGTGDDVVEVGPDGSLTARAQTQAEVETLRQAQALQQLRAKNTNEDWRLRISLAPGANYLYRAPDAGILQPLLGTSGVVFPYTPQITTNYKASYDIYDLVHTNYKSYFYKNSSVEEISITGIFTANSAAEADYLLAVIHFFRSASKMFYGQDSNPVAGTPPPVLFMDGLGVYQFNEHPCLLSNFNYVLPNDVDYIRAGGARNYSGGAVNLAGIRNQQGAASNSPLSASLSRLTSLKNTFDNFINPGARANNPVSQNTTNYYGIAGQPTYVPTKLSITITLLPLISRQEQAQSFSLKNYATGQGLRERGFF